MHFSSRLGLARSSLQCYAEYVVVWYYKLSVFNYLTDIFHAKSDYNFWSMLKIMYFIYKIESKTQ